MKRLIIGLCLVAIFVVTGTACANQAATNASTPFVADSKQDTSTTIKNVPNPQLGVVINVDDLKENPGRYTGSIRVEGVVSSISSEQRTIGIIDSREFAACGVTTCYSFILPVQWSGPFPSISDTVQIAGQILKISGKFVFVAQSLETIKRQTGS